MPTALDQLKGLKEIKPRTQWMEVQRDLLLSQITRQQSAPQAVSHVLNYWILFKSILPTGVVRFAARPIGIVTALLVIAFSSGLIGVNASKGSLPGDFLYPVKLTSEKVRIGLTASGQDKAKAHVENAEERVREIEQIVQATQSSQDKSDKVKIAVAGLKDEMQQAKQELDIAKEAKTSTATTVSVAREVNNKTITITNKVREVQTAQAIITGEQTGKPGDPAQAIIKTLDEAATVSDETGVKAVEVIIEKHNTGDSSLSDKEVLDVVAQKITNAETTVKDVTEKVTQAGTVVGQDGKAMTEDKQTNPPTETTGTATQAKQDSNEQIIGDIKDKPVEAQKILTEAKDLLNQGDLGSALDKLTQSVQIVREVNTKVETLQQNSFTTVTQESQTVPEKPIVPVVPPTVPEKK